ncbi:uncharacterized protein K452DRAFT_272864 [Aplosporella prunicola CBS 121167]|uniref:Cytochrome P450 n=1 Tax=Aplosporella prunicola CBS 121167 TaxID=1176127 RepID=A0A6A6BCN3_9PEZI|nr:uncharacterized protein K452DRAFT_272864 [Aplosporella prunicola CBS 121167]KAF2141045.1 hypothetical protein K452DRAFT_272864 [Aplosporella prunicola CBS 121167]
MESPADAPVAGGLSIYIRTAALVAAVIIVHHLLKSPSNNKHAVLPAWVPLEIFIASSCIQAGGIWLRMLTSLRQHSGALFGLAKSHQLIHNLAGIDRLLASPHHVLSTEPIGWSILVRVFGVANLPALRARLIAANKELFAAVERNFLHEGNALAAIHAAAIPSKASALVTLAPNQPLQPWEHAATAAAAEVDLFALVRDFGAALTLPLLYGHDFSTPALLADFWAFDHNAFALLAAGLPSWLPLPALRRGLAARRRLHAALTDLYARLEADAAALTDVGPVVRERCAAYAKHDVPLRYRGQIDLALLWAANANTQPLVGWLVVYIYATPGLLSSLRAETAPHVHLSADGMQITAIDHAGLARECPRLKSALLETMRTASASSSLRYVARPVTVPDGPREHVLPPDTFISVPHGLAQMDGALFPDPRAFVPERFVVDAEPERSEDKGRSEGSEGSGGNPRKTTTRYGSLRPWGGGAGMCKGRVFAEKEILAVVAAVINLWEFTPVGAEWHVPTMLPGTGVMRPRGDVRVVVTRRGEGVGA